MGMHQLALTRNSHTPGTQDVEASVDGVLGGFGTVTDVDIKESDEFLSHLQAHKLLNVEASSRAADCGAGIILMWKETGCWWVKAIRSRVTDIILLQLRAWCISRGYSNRHWSHQRRHALPPLHQSRPCGASW